MSNDLQIYLEDELIGEVTRLRDMAKTASRVAALSDEELVKEANHPPPSIKKALISNNKATDKAFSPQPNFPTAPVGNRRAAAGASPAGPRPPAEHHGAALGRLQKTVGKFFPPKPAAAGRSPRMGPTPVSPAPVSPLPARAYGPPTSRQRALTGPPGSQWRGPSWGRSPTPTGLLMLLHQIRKKQNMTRQSLLRGRLKEAQIDPLDLIPGGSLVKRMTPKVPWHKKPSPKEQMRNAPSGKRVTIKERPTLPPVPRGKTPTPSKPGFLPPPTQKGPVASASDTSKIKTPGVGEVTHGPFPNLHGSDKKSTKMRLRGNKVGDSLKPMKMKLPKPANPFKGTGVVQSKPNNAFERITGPLTKTNSVAEDILSRFRRPFARS